MRVSQGRRSAQAFATALCLFVLLSLIITGCKKSEVVTDTPATEVGKIRAQRAKLDETVWKQEVRAQRYESYFVDLWDRLRASQQPFEVLSAQQFDAIMIGSVRPPRQLENQITAWKLGPGSKRNHEEWKQFVAGFRPSFKLEQSEWHHRQFALVDDLPQSTIDATLHLVDSEQNRYIIKAVLIVDWPSDGQLIPANIDVRDVTILQKSGPPQFRLAATLPAATGTKTDFLAAYDMDGDGLSEILFGNQLFRNRGDGNFSAERLAKHRTAALQSAVLADFNRDGKVDLLCVDPGQRPTVLLADNLGRFSNPARPILDVKPIVEFSTSVTAGDVNGDGFLDVWLTQYKAPYRSGQMPTPFYNANDGHESYLLINDGRGQFIDETEPRGLASKRRRRTYSSSFNDIDEDGDLDLVVVSDFAGLDVYQNDGTGKFLDATSQLCSSPRTFGMSHVIADFNADEHLDLFVCGMGSTTARRLDAMQAGPPQEERTRMRSRMGYGNHLYLWEDSAFHKPPYADQVARTGWSWGAVDIDFDNDGDKDIYVGNGHISGASSRDYCSVFWRHDIYTGDSNPNPILEQFFKAEQASFQSSGSWNGYEHNCLLMNTREGFVEVGFLFGLAHEFDTRNIVADDIDGNGLMDLLVVEHPLGQPANLRVWKNYGRAGNWIGVAVSEQSGNVIPGTRIVVRTDSQNHVACVISGDSFNSQHAATEHFGLGDVTEVESIEVTYGDGTLQRLNDVETGMYHVVP